MSDMPTPKIINRCSLSFNHLPHDYCDGRANADTPTPRTDAELVERLRKYSEETKLLQARLDSRADDDGRSTAFEQAAARIEQLERELAEAKRENAQWRQWNIVEIAVRNPQVADWMRHWEGRAEKAEAALAEAQRALGNCYTLSRRMLQKDSSNEYWQHIKRFCEETGMRAEILRASFPTEVTDGGDSIDAAMKEGK